MTGGFRRRPSAVLLPPTKTALVFDVMAATVTLVSSGEAWRRAIRARCLVRDAPMVFPSAQAVTWFIMAQRHFAARMHPSWPTTWQRLLSVLPPQSARMALVLGILLAMVFSASTVYLARQQTVAEYQEYANNPADYAVQRAERY